MRGRLGGVSWREMGLEERVKSWNLEKTLPGLTVECAVRDRSVQNVKGCKPSSGELQSNREK